MYRQREKERERERDALTGQYDVIIAAYLVMYLALHPPTYPTVVWGLYLTRWLAHCHTHAQVCV